MTIVIIVHILFLYLGGATVACSLLLVIKHMSASSGYLWTRLHDIKFLMWMVKIVRFLLVCVVSWNHRTTIHPLTRLEFRHRSRRRCRRTAADCLDGRRTVVAATAKRSSPETGGPTWMTNDTTQMVDDGDTNCSSESGDQTWKPCCRSGRPSWRYKESPAKCDDRTPVVAGHGGRKRSKCKGRSAADVTRRNFFDQFGSCLRATYYRHSSELDFLNCLL